MYEMNDVGFWRQHREDLLREAENGRLARRLKATRQKGTSRLRDALLRRVPGAAYLRAGDGRCA